MKNLSKALLASWAFMAYGCAHTPSSSPLPPVASPKDIPLVVLERYPTPEEKFSLPSAPDSYISVAGNKTGSLGLGLLLGPIGVLANTAYVDAKTAQQAATLGDFTKVNLRQLLAAKVGASKASTRYELVPSANIQFLPDEKRIACACDLHVYLVEKGNVIWRTRYRANIKDVYQVGAPPSLNHFESDLGQCLDNALELFKLHTGGKLTFVPSKIQYPTWEMYVNLYEGGLPKLIVSGPNDVGELFVDFTKDIKAITRLESK